MGKSQIYQYTSTNDEIIPKEQIDMNNTFKDISKMSLSV